MDDDRNNVYPFLPHQDTSGLSQMEPEPQPAKRRRTSRKKDDKHTPSCLDFPGFGQ